MVMKSGAVRSMAVLLFLVMSAACRPTRMVKLAWDQPAVAPLGYRILVDDHVVLDIPPPPLDPSCKCPTVTVPVPRGQHTVAVIAYNQFGNSAPSAVTVVK
jgi:hypothetical protein